jgi:FkbM family methyltransferase
MGRRAVGALGSVARAARNIGLGSVFSLTRDGLDALFLRAQRPPLHVSVGGMPVRGFLRHRSFLADVARPGRTYSELFLSTLRPGMTVVDGGAHVGLYTLLGARAVGANGQVFAFEPDPYNHRALAHNVRALGLPNVGLDRRALADSAGSATFHLSRGTIGSSLRPRDDTSAVATVETTTIDATLADANPPALVVKLNVEGAEPRILEGMRETNERVSDLTMFVEIDPIGLRLAGSSAEELVERLELLGFDVYTIRLADQTLTRVDRATPLAKGYLMCVRRGTRPDAVREER